MSVNNKGSYVKRSEYEKLKEYSERLYEIAYNNCSGLSQDELSELNEEYGQK